MKRITISLPDDLAIAVRRQARRQGVSVSEVSRQALADQLTPGEHRRLGFVGLGHSGERTTARDAEGILEREWNSARRS